MDPTLQLMVIFGFIELNNYLYLLTMHAYLLGTGNVNTRSVLLSIEAELKVISDIVWKSKLITTSAIRGDAQATWWEQAKNIIL